jgi:hypothetical protein
MASTIFNAFVASSSPHFASVKRMLHKPHTDILTPERPTQVAFALTENDLEKHRNLVHPTRTNAVFLQVTPENKALPEQDTMLILGSDKQKRAPLKEDKAVLLSLINEANVSKGIKRRMRKALSYQLDKSTPIQRQTLTAAKYLKALGPLSETVIGQEKNLLEFVGQLSFNHLHRTNFSRPAVLALLIGPAESGKTLTLNTLTKATGQAVINVNCVNYSDTMASLKVFGSPPGYIGYGDNSSLLDKIEIVEKEARERGLPNPMVIFDELIKMSPDLVDLLTKAIAEGVLWKPNGTKVDVSIVDFIATMSPQDQNKLPTNIAGRFNVIGTLSHLSEVPYGLNLYLEQKIEKTIKKLNLPVVIDGPTRALLHYAASGLKNLRKINQLVASWISEPVHQSVLRLAQTVEKAPTEILLSSSPTVTIR